MSASIPSVEPASFIAGDTVKWTKSLADYSAADSWVLTYEFRGNVRKTVTCTASGSDHLATITATLSAAYPAGLYGVIGRVAKSGEVYTVWQGSIRVEPDPSIGTASQDRRSHARKMLDAIEAMMEGNASREESSYSISAPGGTARQLQLCSKEELIKFHSHYKQLVYFEDQAERIAQGLAPKNKVNVRFIAPGS